MKRHLLLFLCLLAGIVACTDIFNDFEDARVDFVTELGLKIGDVSLYIDTTLNFDIEPLIDGTPVPIIELSPGEDGVLNLHFQQKLPTIRLDTLLQIKDTLLYDSIDFPAVFGFFIEGNTRMGFQLATFSQELFEGKSIDSLKLDAGSLTLDFNTYEQFSSRFNFSFPGITDENNEILSVDDFVPTEEKHVISLDLTGHKLQLSKKGDREYFFMDMYYYIESIGDEANVKPQINILLKDLDLNYAYGNMGYDTIPDIGRQTLAIPDFLERNDLQIDFERPEIRIYTLNSFSLPLRYDVQDLVMYFSDGRAEDVTGFPESIYLGIPDPYFQKEYVSSSISLEPTTNIDILLTQNPDSLLVNGVIVTNPDNPELKNYIRDTDSLASELFVDLPFSMRISEIVLRDTLEGEIFEFLDQKSLMAEKLGIEVDVSNSFPFTLCLQAFFYDGNELLIDSLFVDKTLISGPVPGEDSYETILEVYKEQNIVKRLTDTQKTILVASFKTSDAEEEKIVSFRNDQKLDLKIKAFARVNVHTE